MTVILEYYNDYNQHGGYFLGVFDKTVSELEEDGEDEIKFKITFPSYKN